MQLKQTVLKQLDFHQICSHSLNKQTLFSGFGGPGSLHDVKKSMM